MKTTSTMELAPVNQACHSASCLLHLAREEGDDGDRSFFWAVCHFLALIRLQT